MTKSKRLAKALAKRLAPESGWFHDPGTSEDLAGVAEEMLGAGMGTPDVEDCLYKVIRAIRNEYGD